MKKLIIFLIKIYQKVPLHSHYACKFYPTCSNYAIQAIKIHGCIKGTYLSIKRIIRCNPKSKGGIDLVPPKNIKSNRYK